jgi:hypothetical protein
MKLRYSLALLVTVALTLAAGAAFAQDGIEAAPKFAGRLSIDLGTGSLRAVQPNSAQVAGDVYANTTTSNFGYTSTDLTATFGDRVTTTGAGVLDQLDFTVYNPSTSAGPLLTATYLISLFDGATSTSLGAFTTNITFGGGAGLAAGFYTIVSVTGLSALSYAVPTDVIVTQHVNAKTGTATRLGIVSFDPPTIGSSIPQMYISTTTTAAGFYNITGYNANPGYRLNVLAAVPAHSTTWGMLKSLYR